MSIKLLVFPAIIIAVLWLMIGFIKPDISDILAKRTELAAKESDLQKVDQVISNIRSMNTEIQESADTEIFMQRYFPRVLEEERATDALNYLASLAGGVVITELNFKENPPKTVPIPEKLYASQSFTAFAEASAAAAEAAAAPAATEESIPSYSATLSAIGSYASLKQFLNLLYHADRMQEVRRFSVEAKKSEEVEKDGQKVSRYPADFLELSLEADFAYVPITKVKNALVLPLFQSSTFDFSGATKLQAHVTSPIPPLNAGQAGKSNPFQ